MFENLKHSCIYNDHNNNFTRICSLIEKLYTDYRNKDKIANFFYLWLFTVRAILATNGSEAVTKFISKYNSIKGTIRFTEYFDNALNIAHTERNGHSFTSLLTYSYVFWSRKLYFFAAQF